MGTRGPGGAPQPRSEALQEPPHLCCPAPGQPHPGIPTFKSSLPETTARRATSGTASPPQVSQPHGAISVRTEQLMSEHPAHRVPRRTGAFRRRGGQEKRCCCSVAVQEPWFVPLGRARARGRVLGAVRAQRAGTNGGGAGHGSEGQVLVPTWPTSSPHHEGCGTCCLLSPVSKRSREAPHHQ